MSESHINSRYNETGIRFVNDDHRMFYVEQMEKLKNDVYHRALVYTLGICGDTRRRFDSIYNAEDRSIDPSAIHAGWQTSGSLKVTRLAFNLFTDGTPSVISTVSSYGDDGLGECRKYSVSDIFCCEFAPYFVEAVKIRYPEYLR